MKTLAMFGQVVVFVFSLLYTFESFGLIQALNEQKIIVTPLLPPPVKLERPQNVLRRSRQIFAEHFWTFLLASAHGGSQEAWRAYHQSLGVWLNHPKVRTHHDIQNEVRKLDALHKQGDLQSNHAEIINHYVSLLSKIHPSGHPLVESMKEYRDSINDHDAKKSLGAYGKVAANYSAIYAKVPHLKPAALHFSNLANACDQVVAGQGDMDSIHEHYEQAAESYDTGFVKSKEESPEKEAGEIAEGLNKAQAQAQMHPPGGGKNCAVTGGQAHSSQLLPSHISFDSQVVDGAFVPGCDPAQGSLSDHAPVLNGDSSLASWNMAMQASSDPKEKNGRIFYNHKFHSASDGTVYNEEDTDYQARLEKSAAFIKKLFANHPSIKALALQEVPFQFEKGSRTQETASFQVFKKALAPEYALIRGKADGALVVRTASSANYWEFSWGSNKKDNPHRFQIRCSGGSCIVNLHGQQPPENPSPDDPSVCDEMAKVIARLSRTPGLTKVDFVGDFNLSAKDLVKDCQGKVPNLKVSTHSQESSCADNDGHPNPENVDLFASLDLHPIQTNPPVRRGLAPVQARRAR